MKEDTSLTYMLIWVIYPVILTLLCDTTRANGAIQFDRNNVWSENPWDLDPYFEKQYYETMDYFYSLFEEDQLLDRRKRSAVEKVEFIIEGFYSENLSRTRTPVNIFSVHNEKQILVHDNIFRVHEHENGVIFFEFDCIINILDEALFVETTEHNGSTMIYMGFSTYSQLHIIPHKVDRNWKESKFNLTFSSETNRPAAAKFIHYKDQLYLAIVYRHKKLNTINSIIYIWTGTYLDELFYITTDGGRDLAVIERDKHFLLIIAQNSITGESNCEVYKFVPEEGVHKINVLKAHGPFRIIAYNVDKADDMYILVINKFEDSQIYKIDKDGEFKLSQSTYNFKSFRTAEAVNVDGKTLILISLSNNVVIYTPNHDALQNIYTVNFPKSKSILNIGLVKPKIGKHSLLVITANDKLIDVNIVTFTLAIDYIVSAPETQNPFDCLLELEAILDSMEDVVDEIDTKIQRIVTKDGSIVDGVLNTTDDVVLVNSRAELIDVNPGGQLLADTNTLLETSAAVDDEVAKLKIKTSNILTKDGLNEFKGSLIVNGDLTVDKLTARYLSTDLINGKPFEANSFLLNNGTQYLPGQWLQGKSVIVKNLTSPLFKSILGKASVFKSLRAESIFLVNKKSINDIDLDNIVLRGHEGIIMGTKTFDRLTTYRLDTDRLGKDPLTPWIQNSLRGESPTKNLRVDNNMTVSKLFAKRINNVDVTELMDSAFQKGVHTQIRGNITFMSDLKVGNLRTEFVDETRVEDFMTKTTEQNISSTLIIKNLLARNIDANIINGINFVEDIAILGRNNTISSPVTLFNLDVDDTLHLNCGDENNQNQSLCNIIPTKPEELLQIYNGLVTITGSLTVEDLKFSKKAQLEVDGKPFTTDVENEFWLTDRSQIIPGNVTFKRGMSVPQISTESINNQPVEDIYSTVNDDRNVSLLMRNVEVRNNVKVAGNTRCSTIREISETAVMTTGVYHIKGRKTFLDTLEVGNLRTDFLNDLKMSDIVLRNNKDVEFTGDVFIKKLIIKGDLIVKNNFEAEIINGVNLNEFFINAVNLDEPTYLPLITFEDGFSAEDLKIKKGPLADIVNNLQNVFNNVEVHVEGNVHIGKMDGVSYINEIDFNDYISRVVMKDEDRDIYGKKHFKNGIIVQNEFLCSNVNDFPIDRLYTDVLTYSGDQDITGWHVVNNIFADQILVDKINGVDMNRVIDLNQDVYFDSDVIFEKLTVEGEVFGHVYTPCDLSEAAKFYKNPPLKEFERITVYGNIFWNYGGGDLSRILEKAVSFQRNAFVEAEVVFEGSISANEVFSDKFINGVDLPYILQDSVKRNSETTQVITGRKIIKNDLAASKATVNVNLFTEYVNGINVLELNRTLVRPYGDYYIRGEKIIESSVQVKNLAIPGKIHGIYLNELVALDDKRTIREAHFDEIEIQGNLYVEKLNGVDFKDFLNSTIKLNEPLQRVYDYLVFETLYLDECNVDSINGVPIEDIVINNSHEPITIMGDVVFKQDVTLETPTMIDTINGYDVSETFDRTMTGEVVEINGDVTFQAPVTLIGNLEVRNMVNNIKLKEYLERDIKETDALVRNIENNLEQIHQMSKEFSIKFMYADVINDVDLKLDDFKQSGVLHYPSFVRVDIHGYLPGTLCGLPKYCICPKQYSIMAFKNASLSITSPAFAPYRMFQLLNPSGYLAQIITTSVTLSKDCNRHSDRTWLSWKTPEGVEVASADLTRYVSGHVSDIRSFYVDGQYYAVIGQYYNPYKDSYNVDATLIRINFNDHTVTLLQRLPTFGAWMLDILDIALGLHLIVANNFDSTSKTSEVPSQIFRFNRITLQFELLQSIKLLGCKSVTTIVGKNENPFIIFSQSGSNPLLILKYDRSDDKFNTYQTIPYGVEVKSTSVYYISDQNSRESFLSVVTSDEKLHIYEYKFSTGWTWYMSKYIPGVQGVVPYSIDYDYYSLVVSNKKSKILKLYYKK